MKTKILLLTSIFVLSTSIAFTATLTVSNHPQGGSQYTTLEAAYNASVNGDTLILEGTGIAYWIGQYTKWSKSITAIGAGFNTNKQLFKKTIIKAYYSYPFRLTTGSDGSSFYGIVFSQKVNMEGNTDNITFEDCEFQDHISTAYSTTNNLTLRNCIFGKDNGVNIYLATSASITVLLINCVFDGYIEGYNNSNNTLIVENSIFLSTTTAHFSGVHNASISNNIFMNNFPGGTTNCFYLNNICRVAGTFPPVGNTGSGNIENADPLLVSYTVGALYSSTHDYHLQSGSACIGAGIGAIDIGIHGGTSTFNESGETLIAPVVRSMQINNTTVAPNGTIDVNISASKPTNN